MTYPTVEAAIAAAYSDHGLRAIDPEAMAQRVSTQRPNPRRTVTVRRTGSEGGYQVREPTSAVERARIRTIVEELPEVSKVLVIGYSLGMSQRALTKALRDRGHAFDQRVVTSLRNNGLAWVELRLRAAELIAA